ncbi:TetR family transcriptional regulator [Streptomyces nojiriensis]|uniref:TetR family transcriptional regulator n=1 Tax=Streptomyces nojiriensis TaxID=66374 RepID=A0ABQ3SIC7_9ACTN|nr:TetR/AcrR family transcriptional regulator [Streptomyces nojiriensis]QTI49509.1 HTH-type transcriptional regulator BetI [Streptomyces nojiriensis]GGS25072.1 TetR family transcriptional regulator [Streptomyces nojiriensis]GHI67895.1 TetR family transcriptional regulator [Streptomyces nojiriensis]
MSAATGPTAKGRQRRTALLDAAEHVLTGAGGSELTLRAVAEEAGVRLGHLQYYFPTRAALLSALLDRILASSLERVTALTVAPAHGSGREALLDAILSDHDDPRLVRLFTEVWALAAHDEEAASAVRAFYGQYVTHVAAFVRDQAPGLSAAEAQHRAEVFVMLMEGAALFRSGVTGRRTAATDARLREAALTLLGGTVHPA